MLSSLSIKLVRKGNVPQRRVKYTYLDRFYGESGTLAAGSLSYYA